MSESTDATTLSVDRLRDQHGAFTMMAIDQRETLREMLAGNRPASAVSDAELAEFKAQVSAALTSQASAILLDRDHGLQAADVADCPVILAADELRSSVPGGPVDIARLDPLFTAETAHRFGAVALKLLVPWLPEHRSDAIKLTQSFVRLCRETGLLSIVEGVFRPTHVASCPPELRSEALVSAAEDLGGCAPDLYKTEVLYTSASDAQTTRDTSAEITARLDCPWVALSSGVPAKDFPNAVAAACAGGADGFLAGRAIWSSATRAADRRTWLAEHSAADLRHLISTTREAVRA